MDCKPSNRSREQYRRPKSHANRQVRIFRCSTTLLGGSGDDAGMGIAVDESWAVCVIGSLSVRSGPARRNRLGLLHRAGTIAGVDVIRTAGDADQTRGPLL